MAEPILARPRRARVRWGGVALVVLVALAGGWTWAWRAAAGRTEAVLDAWMLRESEVGRVWTCPGRRVAGFPFAIRVGCAAPHFSGDLAGTHAEGRLGGFEAVAAVYHPTEIRAELTGPFAVTTAAAETDLAIGWSRLRLVLAGLPTAVSEAAVTAADVTVSGTIGGLGEVAATAAAVTAGARRDPGRTDEAYAFVLTATGAVVPSLDALLGGDTPASIDVAGTLTEADFAAPGLPVDQIERWRAAGGHIDLARLIFTRGLMRLEATGGPLSLDPAHRPQGRLDARAEGFDPVLRRLGVNPAVVAIGGLLGGVLGARSQGGGAGLHLPLGFDHGLLVIGPVRTSIEAPPLY